MSYFYPGYPLIGKNPTREFKEGNTNTGPVKYNSSCRAEAKANIPEGIKKFGYEVIVTDFTGNTKTEILLSMLTTFL